MQAGELTVTFAFLDPASGRPLVKGEERIWRDGADLVKHTVYSSLAGQKSQVEAARYGAASLQLEHYCLDDQVTGERADVRVAGGRAAVQYRAGWDAALKTGDIPWGPAALSGKSLPELILQRWALLVAGEVVDFDLYIPFRLETIGFRLRRQGGGSAEAGATLTIVAEARHWLVRQVAPSIAFVFAAAVDRAGDCAGVLPRLLRYKGPSPVDIGGVRYKGVEIDFT